MYVLSVCEMCFQWYTTISLCWCVFWLLESKIDSFFVKDDLKNILKVANKI